MRRPTFFPDKYFHIADDKTKSVCKTCSKEFRGYVAGNLKRHVVTVHRVPIASRTNNMSGGRRTSMQKPTNGSPGVVSKPAPPAPMKLINYNMTAKQFMRACIEMVTRDEIPFQIMHSNAFRSIIDPICSEIGVTINAESLMQTIREAAIDLRSNISNELAGQLFSLKIDSVSRYGREFLGIHAQFLANDMVEIRTLAITEIKGKLTAENLKAIIEMTLSTYNCTIIQVCSITTDNGASMVWDEQDQEIIDNTENAVLEGTIITSKLKCVRCASQILQLAVMDLLKNHEHKLNLTRDLVNNVRTGQMRQLLEARQIEIPPLDVPTRWTSTFLMIKSFMDQMEFYRGLQGVDISDDLWFFMYDLNNTLKPVYDCTQELQTNQFCIGDFLTVCIKLKLNLSKIGTNLAKEMVQCMIQQSKLLENDVIRAALYIDPRFNFTGSNSVYLSSDGKQCAEEYLLNLYQNMESISISSPTDADAAATNLNIPIQEDILENELEIFYNAELGVGAPADVKCPQLHCVRDQIAELKNRPRAPLSSDIYKICNELKNYTPGLYKLVSKLLAVSSTIMTIDRVLSAFELIRSNIDMKFEEEDLQNILLIKLNVELLLDTKSESSV